jgi:peptidoglycan/xylan/chitin deacetylase (PgdA/CDA1 family)
MGVRNNFLAWMDRVGALTALMHLRARRPAQALPILAYHRVFDVPPGYPFDTGVIDCTPAAFDEQMATLRRHFSVVGIDEVLAFVAGEPLPPNPVMITFDDGYVDNHNLALPILRRHGIRAVFFVSSGNLVERRLFWWDRIAYLLSNATVPVARLEYPAPLVFDLCPAHRGRALATALRIVKSQYDLDLDRFLDELGAALEVPWDAAVERRLADGLLMTWDQVRALERAGMEIGSHTRTHRVLHTLRPGPAAAELGDSKAEIEAHIAGRVRAIAYPVGGSLRGMPSITRAVAAAGYAAGFTMTSRLNRVDEPRDPFDVHRIAMHTDLVRTRFRARLTVPGIS